MRNLIANIYCTRDRNTLICPLHNTGFIDACIKCEYSRVELTDPGNKLMMRGLPRLTPGMDLDNFIED